MTVTISNERMRSWVLTLFAAAMQEGLTAREFLVLECVGMAQPGIEVDVGSIMHVTKMCREEVLTTIEGLKLSGVIHDPQPGCFGLTSLGEKKKKGVWGE